MEVSGELFGPPAPKEMQFILSTYHQDKSEDPEMRKAIRRHVMLGKNRGKSYPYRRKPARRANPLLGFLKGDLSTPSASEKSLLGVPKQIGSDLSSLPWAGGVDVSTIAVIMEFSNLTKSETFPIEVYMDHPPKDIRWLEPLLSDDAWVHTMAFSAHAYCDMLRHRSTRPINQWASPHFAETIHILRKRMRLAESIAISNSTLLVVMALATHANLHGEFAVARCHVLGLYRIVELRGGINTFRPYHKLLAEILRADISLSLHTGESPLFLQDLVSSSMHWPCPKFAQNRVVNFNSIGKPFALPYNQAGYADHNLEQSLAILLEFSQQLNKATKAKSQLPKEFLLDTMVFVTYRLLYLRFSAESLDQVLRMGLLAFCSGTFIQWRHVIPAPSSSFSASFRETLAYFGSVDGSPRFLLWMLMLGALTIFTNEDKVWLHPWLRTAILRCGVDSWSGISEILHSFPWIDILYEQPGQALMVELLTQSTGNLE